MQATSKRQSYIVSVTSEHQVFDLQSTRGQGIVYVDKGRAELKPAFCPVVESLHLVGNEKKLIVVRYLLDRPMRFSELSKAGLDSKTLSRALKSLEKEGVVKREIVSTQPFSVQYSLTEMGRQLEPVIESLRVWSEKWIVPRMQSAQVIEEKNRW